MLWVAMAAILVDGSGSCVGVCGSEHDADGEEYGFHGGRSSLVGSVDVATNP